MHLLLFPWAIYRHMTKVLQFNRSKEVISVNAQIKWLNLNLSLNASFNIFFPYSNTSIGIHTTMEALLFEDQPLHTKGSEIRAKSKKENSDSNKKREKVGDQGT